MCWHVECSTLTATSSGIWNSSAELPSPPLALNVVMLPNKAHLTSHSRMNHSRWVITSLWLSRSWISFLYSSSVYSCHFFISFASVAAKLLQLCLTLCDPVDGSPPGSPIPGILQARTLEWVVISFSNAWKWNVKVKSLSARLLATPWTAAYQAPPSMGFPR